MAAIFLFYLPFSFYHADMLVNNAGVSENELQGLKKTTAFSDANNVGPERPTLYVTLYNTMLLFRVQAVILCMPDLQFSVGPDLTPLDFCGTKTRIQYASNMSSTLPNPHRPSSDTTTSKGCYSHVQKLARVLFGFQAWTVI
jgi:hypothetical protein